jgi:TonB family protein
MKHAVTVLLVCFSAVCHAAASSAVPDAETPEGVKYIPAGPAQLEAATTKLHAALTGDPAVLAGLMGLDADHTVLVGPYFALEISGDGLRAREVLSDARYNLPVPDADPLVVDSYRAKTRDQKLFLAHYVHLMADFSGPLTIRAPTFDELAITWAWIAWQLEGPLLVAESANDKYLFHFEPTGGHLFWVERLTKPCFTALQEDKEVLPCACTVIARDGRKWDLRFQPLASCPATGASTVAAAASRGNAANPPAFIEVDDRTARVDVMLARKFGADYAISALDIGAPGFKGPGKLLEGAPPVAPKDARGEPVHGYVLLGSVISSDGRVTDNRVLITTDERVSAAVLEAAKGWRLEPATRDGKPVAELVWQQLTL